MTLIRPRFIALDTPQLAAWARDSASPSPEERARAAQFEAAMRERGCVVFLSLHHLIELFGNANEPEAKRRLAFIETQSMLAWPAPVPDREGVGTSMALLAAEVRTSRERPRDDALAVRDRVRAELMKVGPGRAAIAPYRRWWSLWRALCLQEVSHRQRIAVVTSPNLFGANEMKISELERGQLRTPEERERKFAQMGLELQREVTMHGDKRTRDGRHPAAIAQSFVARLLEAAPTNVSTVDELFARLKPEMGVDARALGVNATVSDIGDAHMYRTLINFAAEDLGLEPHDVEQVRCEQLPSLIVDRAFARYAHGAEERRGSDLGDRQLLCFAPYTDLMFVDKRTHENVRQARAKSRAFERVMGAVTKVVPYFDAPVLL